MGRELTPRIYSQLRRVDRRCREKFLQFARCFYDNIGQPSVDLLDLRLEGTELDSLSAKNLWRKKISLEQIFTSWCLIAKITKISASQKFPAIRYICNSAGQQYD